MSAKIVSNSNYKRKKFSGKILYNIQSVSSTFQKQIMDNDSDPYSTRPGGEHIMPDDFNRMTPTNKSI